MKTSLEDMNVKITLTNDLFSNLSKAGKKTLALLSHNFDSEKERLEIFVWIKVD